MSEYSSSCSDSEYSSSDNDENLSDLLLKPRKKKLTTAQENARKVRHAHRKLKDIIQKNIFAILHLYRERNMQLQLYQLKMMQDEVHCVSFFYYSRNATPKLVAYLRGLRVSYTKWRKAQIDADNGNVFETIKVDTMTGIYSVHYCKVCKINVISQEAHLLNVIHLVELKRQTTNRNFSTAVIAQADKCTANAKHSDRLLLNTEDLNGEKVKKDVILKSAIVSPSHQMALLTQKTPQEQEKLHQRKPEKLQTEVKERSCEIAQQKPLEGPKEKLRNRPPERLQERSSNTLHETIEVKLYERLAQETLQERLQKKLLKNAQEKLDEKSQEKLLQKNASHIFSSLTSKTTNPNRLSLTWEQKIEIQEIFRNANQVSTPEKALIVGFMAGGRENPCPHLGSILWIKLSEKQETIRQEDGQLSQVICETHFEMNYNNGKYQVVQKFRAFGVSK